MAIIDVETLASGDGPLMGLDPGTRTLGVAVSDATRLIASPLTTIRRKKFTPDATALLRLYADNNCSALVVGLPLNMDGSAGPRVQSVRDFCTNLLRLQDLPILMWDERLSTAAVTRQMIAADVSRAKRAEHVDAQAAAYILQGVLDRMRV